MDKQTTKINIKIKLNTQKFVLPIKTEGRPRTPVKNNSRSSEKEDIIGGAWYTGKKERPENK